MKKPDQEKPLGAEFFTPDNPLNFLLRQDNAQILKNPHVLDSIIENPIFRQNLLAFMSPKDKGSLWPINLGKHKDIVAVVPVKKGETQEMRFRSTGKKERKQVDSVGIVIGTIGAINELARESLREKEKSVKGKGQIKKPKKEAGRKLHPYYKEINRALDVWEKQIGSGTIIEQQTVKEGGSVLLFKNKIGREKHLISHEMPKVTRWKNGVEKGSALIPSTRDRGVVGIYLPPDGQNNPKVLEKTVRGLAWDLKLKPEIGILAIATEKQMNEWRKYGFFTELLPHRHEEGAPSLRRVLGYLREALGPEVDFEIKNLSNGKVDIVFVPKNPRVNGELAYYDVLGIEKGKLKNVKNTVGVVCVESAMSDEDKKAYAKQVRQGLRLVYTNGPRASSLNVLTVNHELLELWESSLKKGEPIATKSEMPRPVESFEYRKGNETPSSDVTDVKFMMFEPGPSAIGARCMQIIVEFSDGREERITLDMGAQYEGFPWSEGVVKPTRKIGATSFRNFIPFIPGFVDSGLLIEMAESRRGPFLRDINDPYLLDLYRTVGPDNFLNLVKRFGKDERGRPLNGDAIIRQLEKLPKKDVRQIGVVESHPHADHVDWMGILSREIPMVFADEAWPFHEVKFDSNLGGWLAEGAIRRDREDALHPGSNYRISPPIHNPEPYKEILIGSGRVGVTLLPVSHSVYGSTAVKVRVFDPSGKPLVSIGYTGDYNFDNRELTERAFREMLDVEYLITDTTNILPSSDKPSLHVTKQMMTDRFTELFKGTRKTNIVGLSWNNLGDANMITEIARSMGKNVYVMPRLGAVIDQMLQLDERRAQTGFKFDWRELNPVPRMGTGSPGIYPYMPPKHRKHYNNAERTLMARYPKTYREIGDIGGKSVVIVPTNPHFYNILATMNHREIEQAIWSTYWPYGRHDKDIVRLNYRFAAEKGFPFLTDLRLLGGNIYPASNPSLHRSGHAKKEEVAEMVRMLFQEGRLGDGGLIPVHGEKREYASNYLREKAGSRGGHTLNVVSRVKKGGFELSLLKR